ncbi:MAG: hypothetical protein KKH41_06445 [Candidatus Thermoplasmatota archaeon]|nr:hypothetical protein [Euryarchaeota archaeon]MBU4032722.1 hypothetical protein [Candidatus Thermoplasmatota archaeon]MBU4071303.1 hypothetical protein [Candidatus Thermoplasmatota archaeon]MBU4143402.1 hypothetical protein [Candidatus Thermoplasmatota archaeon]MBU4592207.1 hypothetical protein [Candidatus Thermoplasmatota archaeon]
MTEGGYYLDDGTKIDEDSIPVPLLCQSCIINGKEIVACNLTRMDQLDEIQKGEMFCCFAYEPVDPTVDKEALFREMEGRGS